MMLPRLYSLQSKFILGLLGIIGVISIINLTALYFFMQNTLEEEVSARASIVLDQVDAVKSYVRTTLRPRMFEELDDTFILEAMSSSFISRRVMERTDDSVRDYVYRRVAINARNPAFEANGVERDLIRYFRDRNDAKVWQGKRMIDGQEVFIMARPVRFTADCLLCHGDPDRAPKELKTLYGSTGYHHKINSLDGIDLVGVPTHHYAARSDAQFSVYVMIYIIISIFVLALIYLTFQRVVVVNFRILSGQFRKNFSDKKSEELLQKVERGDEIEEMIEGMEGLSQHLYETEQQLKRYNADLENEVDRRTRQLSLENERHRKDLALFVDILRALKDSQDRAGMWHTVLPILARSLNLKSASYVCTYSSNQSFSWPENGPVSLPDDHVTLLVSPTVRLKGNIAYVPVGSSDDDIEGLLCLVREDNSPFSSDETEMLTAVGRQLGIAAENLAALAAMLSESNNLQTVFEGITDPLILMERSGAVIMANRAANRLIEALRQDRDGNALTMLVPQLHDVTADSAYNSREVTLANGRNFIVTTFPLSGKETQIERLVIAIQENTEKKKMMQQVVQSEKMATVGKLAAGLAHEINNPLGVILCYAELMRKSLVDEQLKEDIDVVIKHTRQAQTVLLDLLNFSRPKVSTQQETVIGEVAEAVMNVFQVQAAKRGVSLNCNRDDEGRTVQIEPQVVEHIMLNLLINALDAIVCENGVIEVSVIYDKMSDAIRLTVEDNGTGIAPEIMPKIFDPFFTTKGVNKGTGLGLAVIYGFMNELGGSIEAANRDEGGTVFTLTFPAA
jgi:two-component system NtrC family sensor kinase